jgi:hypothetical protein
VLFPPPPQPQAASNNTNDSALSPRNIHISLYRG